MSFDHQGSGTSLGVKDEGTTVVAAASAIDFVGAGVTATDGGSGKATVTIPGGGSAPDVFNITTYGATTGSSDNTAAVQAAIAAAYANGGGVVYVPAGTFICTGQLSIPGGVSAGQVAITIKGCAPQGIAMANIEASEPSTGSVLDLRFSNAGATGKIVALYEGIFGLKDIRIGCGLSTKDDTPLVYTTLPQPRFEAVTFFGNTTHRTTACVQDAIVFGGTGVTHTDGSTSSPFSGYGGFVRECAFWAIRKHVLMQNWCNGVVVEGCITDRSSCGSSETNSAPYVIDTGGTSASYAALGNIFQNNTIEVEQYNYAFRFKNNAQHNVVRGNGIWDASGTTLGLAYIEESSGAINNWLRFDGYYVTSSSNIGGVTLGNGQNVIEKFATSSVQTLFDYKPAGWQMFFNGTTNGNQSLIYDSGIDGPLLSGNGGVGIRSAGRNQKAGLYAGSGSPNSIVTATPGSVYFNVAGGASTSFYVKESGTGNTGWVAYGAPTPAVATDVIWDAKGDLAVGTGADTASKLTVGANGLVPVAKSGATVGMEWNYAPFVIDEVHADTTVVNTTTETNLSSLAIPGGVVAAGDYLELVYAIDSLNNTGGSVNYEWRFKIGATTVLDTGLVAVGTGVGRNKIYLNIGIFIESTTAQRVTGLFMQNRSSASWVVSAAVIAQGAGYGTAAEDLSTAKNCVLTVQMGTASASADAVLHAASLRVCRKAV